MGRHLNRREHGKRDRGLALGDEVSAGRHALGVHVCTEPSHRANLTAPVPLPPVVLTESRYCWMNLAVRAKSWSMVRMQGAWSGQMPLQPAKRTSPAGGVGFRVTRGGASATVSVWTQV